MKFSQRSIDNLKGVHPKLVKVVERALSYKIMDFAVTAGVRTLQQQQDLYEQGRSLPGPIVTNTMKSDHLINPVTGFGHAVDIHPFPINYNDTARYNLLAALMFRAAAEEGVSIDWGGFWKKFKDLPHYAIL